MMTPITFDEARRRRKAAGQQVPYIAAGRIENWPLHIPAREDDPDVVLDDALLALDEMIRRAEQAEQLALAYQVLLRWVMNMAARNAGVPEDAPPFADGYWRAVFEDANAAGAFAQADCGTQGITEAMLRLGVEAVDPPPSAAQAMAELRDKFGHYFDAIEDVDEWVKQQRDGEDPPPTRP